MSNGMQRERDDEPRVRILSPDKKKFAFIAGGVVSALSGIIWGIRPIWSEIDKHQTVQGGGVVVAATATSYLMGSYYLDRPSSASNNRRTARVLAGMTVAVGALLTAIGYAKGLDGEQGTATAPVTASSLAQETGSTVVIAVPSSETAAFVYNDGQPIPEGSCTVPAPISGSTPEVIEGVRNFENLLQAAGFNPGTIDGKADADLSLAVNQVQIAFGMPESLANDPSTRWKPEDCYQASTKILGLSELWVPAA